MAEKRFVFTADQIQAIRQVIRDEKDRLGNTANRPAVPVDISHAPEVYVAYASAPIPPMDEPHGSSSFAAGDDRLHSLDCPIFHVVFDRLNNATLERVQGLSKRVYNLSHVSQVARDQFFLIKRDKFGVWFADNLSVSSLGGGVPDTWGCMNGKFVFLRWDVAFSGWYVIYDPCIACNTDPTCNQSGSGPPACFYCPNDTLCVFVALPGAGVPLGGFITLTRFDPNVQLGGVSWGGLLPQSILDSLGVNNVWMVLTQSGCGGGITQTPTTLRWTATEASGPNLDSLVFGGASGFADVPYGQCSAPINISLFEPGQPLVYMTLALGSSSDCRGTGTGTGSQCSISRAGLGTVSSGGAGVTNLTLPGIHLNVGDTLLVVVGMAHSGGTTSPPLIQWGSQSLNLIRATGDNSSAGIHIQAALYAGTVVAAGTNDITLSGSISAYAMQAIEVLCTGSTADQTASVSGGSSAPDSGATGTTGAAAEYAQGFCIHTPGGAQTWTNSFTSGGQDVTFNSGGHNIVLTEAYRVLSSTTTVDAAITQTYNAWGIGVATFQ